MAYNIYAATGASSRGYYVTTGVVVYTEDRTNNRSYIGVWFDLHSGSSAFFQSHALSGGFAWYVNGAYIGGWSPSGQYSMPGFNSWIRLYWWEGWVGHNSNGALAMSSNGWVQMVNQSPSLPYSLPPVSVSGSGNGPDYDRRPAAPTTVSVTINADKTIFVQSNAVSSPASTAQYAISFSTSTNNSTWSAWSADTNLGSSRSTTYPATAFSRGIFIRFRMRASNTDGTSAYTTSASVFYPAGGRIFRSGSFAPTNIARRREGTTWKDIQTAKIFRNGQWVNLS